MGLVPKQRSSGGRPDRSVSG
ncbi:hypothetical protein NKH16_23955 [Mesorhizobium sp. M1307]